MRPRRVVPRDLGVSSLRRSLSSVPSEEMCVYRSVPTQIDLPTLDHEVLRFWRESDIFARSLEQSQGRPEWVFLRGATDRQRYARCPPHRGAGVQGRLRTLSDDEGLPRQPQGGLGLLFREFPYEHSYPHCWRAATRLCSTAPSRPGTSAPRPFGTPCCGRTNGPPGTRRP